VKRPLPFARPSANVSKRPPPLRPWKITGTPRRGTAPRTLPRSRSAWPTRTTRGVARSDD
jgi:hypothetical protein